MIATRASLRDRFAAALFPAAVLGTTFAVDAMIPRGMEYPRIVVLSTVVITGLTGWAAVGLMRPLVLRLSWVEALLLAAIVAALASNPTSASSGDPYLLSTWISLAAMVLLTRQAVRPPDADGAPSPGVDDLLHTVWIVGVALSLIGLRQAWTAGTFQYADGGIKTPMMGPLGTANGFGGLVGLGALAAFALAARPDSGSSRRLLLGAGLLCTVALLGNGSRGALLGLGAGLVVLLFAFPGPRAVIRSRSARWWRLPALAVVVAVIVGGLALLDLGSTGGRLMVWGITVPMLLDNPWTGVGFGRFAAAFPDYQAAFFADPTHLRWAHKATALTHPHSDWLRPFAEGGWLNGFLAVAPWAIALAAYARAGSDSDRLRWAGPLALLTAVCVHGSVDTIRLVLPVAVIGAVLLGLAPVREWSWRPALAGRGVMLALVLTGSWWLSTEAVRTYSAQHAWATGRGSVDSVALRAFSRALEDLPGDPLLLADHGRALVAAGAIPSGLDAFTRAVESGADPELRLTMGRILLESGDAVSAEREARLFLSAFPDRLRPRLLLARIHLARGEEAKAQEELLRCIHLVTRTRSAAVDAVATEALELWRSHFSAPPPARSTIRADEDPRP